ncbi:hypothetical protein [Aquimarina aquimarini]|uniref:hypothetical protein n=1 Tax=Aquimarina aquimarini TaxID=1191734 RepID=UPI001F27EF7B|nr:hypothetical protein [Aquimarina aquimarini]
MANRFNTKGIAIRIVLNEAKSLFEENKIDIIEYRLIIRQLLNEVKTIDRNFVNEDIRGIFESYINKNSQD